jgi:hypothetical protein
MLIQGSAKLKKYLEIVEKRIKTLQSEIIDEIEELRSGEREAEPRA